MKRNQPLSVIAGPGSGQSFHFKSAFPGMGAADSRSLRSDSYVRMQHFVRRTTYVPFRRFWGDVRREFMQRLSAALHGTLSAFCHSFCCSSWVPISTTLCGRAVLMLWYAFLFLGLRLFSLFLGPQVGVMKCDELRF
jgi:hypothetical protein